MCLLQYIRKFELCIFSCVICIFSSLSIRGENIAIWQETSINEITPTDEIVIAIRWISASTSDAYYYALTSTSSENVSATSILVAEDMLLGEITSKFTWYIDQAEDNTISIYSELDHSRWLYRRSTTIEVGTENDRQFNLITIDGNLYLQNDKYIGLKTDYNTGYPYWTCDDKCFDYQSIVFFKKNIECSLPVQIIEWKKDAIVVMYNGSADQDVRIYINEDQVYSGILSQHNKDVAIYEIPIPNLSSNTNLSLDVVIANQKKTCIIPLIISEETSTNDVVNLSLNTDIVIQKGGILTLNSSEINAQTWGNVTIYGGGKIIVGPECAFNASSIIMRVGSVENGEYQAAYPQFVLQGQLGTVSNFYIDYLTTYDRYYALSIPYAVNTEDIHYPIDIYGANVLTNNKGSFTLQYYDGALRAKTGMGWKDLDEPATLNPYQGYTFWGAPKRVSVNGAEKERQKFGIHRLPIHNVDIINKNEIKNNDISVIAHGNEQTNDNDRGWNFLGNPYLGEYTGTIGDIRYITQTNDGKKYFSNEVADVTLDPFNTYFVQVDENQNIPFNILNSLYMQSPQKDKYDEIATGILLSCDEMVDRVGVLIADRYTENYDFNADLAKFDNHDLTVYAISKSGKLSYTAISPQTANQSIEIGYKVLEGNQFTFQFDDSRYEAQDIDKLYLIDKELNVTTDLLQTDYSFYSDAGTYDQRFALDIRFHENNTTNIPQYSQEPNIILENQSLNISNLPVGTRVSIYNVLGHCFYQQAATSSELSIQLPRGYYILYINCAQGLHRTIFIQ